MSSLPLPKLIGGERNILFVSKRGKVRSQCINPFIRHFKTGGGSSLHISQGMQSSLVEISGQNTYYPRNIFPAGVSLTAKYWCTKKSGVMFPIHHIGIAVPDIETGISLYSGLCNPPVVHREILVERAVELCFLQVPNTLIELLAPKGEGTISKYLKSHGPGIHHICFEVPDIEQEMFRLKKRGYELIDNIPRPGAEGHMIAFLQPKTTGGSLIELLQNTGHTSGGASK